MANGRFANMIVCRNCQTAVHRDARRIAGCGCDPDAPTWCYIEPNRGQDCGIAHGMSSAKFDVIIGPDD